MATVKRLGGSFAPPLTDELLAKYRERINNLDRRSPIKDALTTLLTCCEKWWELPESNGTSKRRHPVGVGIITDLEDAHKETLWNLIPWNGEKLPDGTTAPKELDAMGALFDQLKGDLRNCAYHLLWHVKELSLDREPLTNDQL